jgi:hypothetical protein
VSTEREQQQGNEGKAGFMGNNDAPKYQGLGSGHVCRADSKIAFFPSSDF